MKRLDLPMLASGLALWAVGMALLVPAFASGRHPCGPGGGNIDGWGGGPCRDTWRITTWPVEDVLPGVLGLLLIALGVTALVLARPRGRG